MVYALLVLAGIGVGLVSSLLGVGGGIFMVPLLLLAGLVSTAQEATGTSIVGVLATGISGSLGYLWRRQTPWRLSLPLMPGALGGGYFGAFLSSKISSGALSLAFGLFLLYPALVLLLGKAPKELVKVRERSSYYPLLGLGVGFLAGTASSLFGVGGGVVMVPALLWLGLSMIQAVAGSLLVMVPSASLATALRSLAGATHWDLALSLAFGILLGAQLGPAVAMHLAPKTLRRLFSLVLLYAAASMIRRGLGY
ncbi:MAG: sulfite exporter TauE/SafE family protein [Candidatus Bipolaricaulaceae bacterium]